MGWTSPGLVVAALPIEQRGPQVGDIGGEPGIVPGRRKRGFGQRIIPGDRLRQGGEKRSLRILRPHTLQKHGKRCDAFIVAALPG
jgi:hypothetical protein